MQAAVLEHYGSPQEFKIKEVPAPEIEDGQVLIRNRASSVNPVDALAREGKLRLASGLLGEPVLGSDFCGTVLATKSNRFKVGDEIYGCASPASGHAYAEQVAVAADVAALKPGNLSFTEAGVLPMAAITAYQGLLRDGRLGAGQRVLINGCTGGVGSAAVQIAKSQGAHVTGTCKGEHTDVARELGCDEVLNYETQPIPRDHSFDLIFDTAAQLTLTDVEDSLTTTGLLVTTKPDLDGVGEALSAGIDLLKARMKMVHADPNPADLNRLRELVEQGQLKPYVARTFPLAEIAQAHEMLAQGGFVGKIALAIP